MTGIELVRVIMESTYSRNSPVAVAKILTCSHAGTQLQLPQGTTTAQLQTLLNSILSNEEPIPYAFYIEDAEVTDEVGRVMLKNDVSVEQVVNITYRPQAIFRIRPVARCSASMEGKLFHRTLGTASVHETCTTQPHQRDSAACQTCTAITASSRSALL